MRRYLSMFAIAVLFVAAFLSGIVQLPYYSVGPGPAREVTPLISVTGHTVYPSSGKLVMTTVRFYKLTPLSAIGAWLDPNKTVVREDVLYPSGQSEEQEQTRAISQMDQSKIDAAFVALHSLSGYPKDHGTGALVESTVSGCAADGKLFSGDVVNQINGTSISSQARAAQVLDRQKVGTPLDFRVTAAGQTEHVTLSRAVCGGSKDPLIGVRLIDPFPFGVQISSGEVGGPSAGLMWSLGLYDELTPGDLTGGATIAGTGTIDLAGTVGPIGGITDKVVAAEGVGATVFLVPRANMKELAGVDTKGMRLIPVATFGDALTALEKVGGTLGGPVPAPTPSGAA
ncbi:MAG: Lon-like protease [Actinomycetota bacterium]|nr:Lon-like protease [Actinomycetota bacterium]